MERHEAITLQSVARLVQRYLLKSHALLFLLFWSSVCDAADSLDLLAGLKHQGTLYRLHGEYEKANKVRDELRALFPDDAIGHVFNLNTLVTRISWDPGQSHFDEELISDAAAALQICTQSMEDDPEDFLGYYYCGQAHFALTYLHAIRGNYFQAAKNSYLTIRQLQQTLDREPGYHDAKMHLGTAYYYVDNLPSFIRALGKFLWFIPSGNSDKSFGYFEDVTEKGQYFGDVAKFVHCDLLADLDMASKQKASVLLQELVHDYPRNKRFQLRLLSVLTDMSRFDESIAAANSFLAIVSEYQLSGVDESLARFWLTRAYLGLGDIAAARSHYDGVERQFELAKHAIPSRYSSWLLLTKGQLQDLQNRREEAISIYQRVIKLSESSYVSTSVFSAAQAGLEEPFKVF